MRARLADVLRFRFTTINVVIVAVIVVALVASFLAFGVSPSSAEEIPDDPAAAVLGSMSLEAGGDVVGPEVVAALSVRSAALIGEEQLEPVSDVTTAPVLVALDPATLDFDTNTEAGQKALAREIEGLIGDVPEGSITNVHQWDGIRGFSADVSLEAVNALATDGDVERINLNNDGAAQLALGESFAASTTSLAAATMDAANDLVDLDEVNTMGYWGEGIEVAVIDSGIDASHPDLQSAVLSEACFAEGGYACPDGPQRATDGNGHGTMVAGIIASRGQTAPVGGTSRVGIHAIKVLDENGRASSSQWILDGMNHVIRNLPNVAAVNISIGSYTQFEGTCDDDSAFTRLYADAISTLRKRGTAVVVAAGNQGDKNTMSAPACVSSAISVGATYSTGVTGIQSTVCSDAETPVDKATCYSNASSATDVFAPGTFIRTSYPEGRVSRGSGTSFASPIVASCVAALRNVDPNANVDTIEQWLESSSVFIQAGTRQFPRLECDTAAMLAGGPQQDGSAPEPTATATPSPTPTPTATPTPTPTAEVEPTPEPTVDPGPDLTKISTTITNSCLEENGRVDLSVTNPLAQEVNLSVDYTNLAPRLLHVGAGETQTMTFTGRPDGLHRLQVHSGDALIANELVRVSCDPEAVISLACLGGNGVVRAAVTNRSGEGADYSLVVGNLAPVTQRLLPLEQATLARSGRPDGSLRIAVLRDGAEITTKEVTVDCDPDVEVQIENSCLSTRGRIDASLLNLTNKEANYRVRVSGLSDRTQTLRPSERGNVAVTGRPDGFYTVTVWRDETRIASKGVNVSCTHDPEKTVVATSSCLAGRGRLDFLIGNVTTKAAEFTVVVAPISPRTLTVEANQSRRVTLTGRPDGVHTAVITRDGLEVYREELTVNCNS